MISCENVFKRIEVLEQEYIKVLEEFCLIESPTDYKAGVDAASNYIVKIAESFGWKIERQKQEVAGDCFCITMNPDATDAPVCLSGHVDTVHPVGLFKDPVVKYDGDKIYGPGVTDCKGGVVASFMAMEALEQVGFNKRPVKLIIQSDEETGSKNSGKIKIFNHGSYRTMEEALAILNDGKIDRILNPHMVDQIIKGLFWIPEEIKNSNRKYGFGELIALLTSAFICGK